MKWVVLGGAFGGSRWVGKCLRVLGWKGRSESKGRVVRGRGEEGSASSRAAVEGIYASGVFVFRPL